MKKICIFFLLWASAIFPAWCGSGAILPVPVLLQKVVRQYALTSANDFSSRDPQDWKMLASNDGGKTWTVLDTRQGELFTERHQRRLFTMANQTAFSLYRLQIDRVRDPVGADAVQIAEIEPLGVMENDFSLLPIFADRIVAKGANPPRESPWQAFDGQVETKWSDLADGNPDTRESWIQWEYLDHSGLVITNIQELFQLRGRAAERYPLRIEGVLVGQDNGTNRLAVLDATGWLEVSVAGELRQFSPGQRVILKGRSQWSGGEIGVEQAGINPIGPPGLAEPRPIRPGQPLASDEDFQWVETEGVVRFPIQLPKQAEFELSENGHSMTVHVAAFGRSGKLPAVGSHVRVRGVCVGEFDDKGVRVAGTLWVAGSNDIVLMDQADNSDPQANSDLQLQRGGKASLLTGIGQIRRLSSEDVVRGLDVQIRGVVTELFGDYVQEESDGIELLRPEKLIFQVPNLGDYVEVRGKTARGGAGGPAVMVEEIKVLGEGKLPEPERPSWSQLAGGQMNGNWIEVDAVVQATDGSHVLLYHEGRQMMATIRSALATRVKSLVDASVQLRGVCVNATDDRNIVQGIQLIIPSLDFVTVKSPPLNSDDIPVWPVSRLYNLGSPNAFNHRVKIKGTLTCQEGRKYFVQDVAGSVMAVAKSDVVLTPRARNPRWVFWQTPEDEGLTESAGDLNPGDEVEVTGYAESYGYAPMLTEALVHRVGIAAAVPPTRATAKELAAGRLDSSVVSIEGMVLGREILGSHFVMQIESDQRVFQASLHIDSQTAPTLALGSLVRLTGVCQMNPISHAELGRAPATFSLLLRTPGDITILKAPSWWTVRRAFSIAGVLVLVLLAALVWVHLLHRQVDERTRRLKQEVAEHEKTEGLLAKETGLLQLEIQKRIRMQAEVEKIHRQLLLTSRLAGMAEVATNVLHNVGNVLNSVNVLASSMSTYLQKSKVPSVARLAELLDHHQGNLGAFLTEDEKGKNVPGHLQRLGAHLLQEQARMLEKAEALTESVQHIKEIVAMQQNYAKVAGVCETVSVAEIVGDAVKMCGEAMARHKIEVVQEFADMAPVILDRHKVLQILFNLLDNAKHACETRGDTEGLVRVRIQNLGTGRIQLQVIDNGIGISKENLPRVFTQGFSTRKGGHGFGLHSSILAAQDMGGSLSVHSEGLGRGAVFTFEMPASIEERRAKLPDDSQTTIVS